MDDIIPGCRFKSLSDIAAFVDRMEKSVALAIRAYAVLASRRFGIESIELFPFDQCIEVWFMSMPRGGGFPLKLVFDGDEVRDADTLEFWTAEKSRGLSFERFLGDVMDAYIERKRKDLEEG